MALSNENRPLFNVKKALCREKGHFAVKKGQFGSFVHVNPRNFTSKLHAIGTFLAYYDKLALVSSPPLDCKIFLKWKCSTIRD